MTRRLWVLGDSWTDPSFDGWGWRYGWPQLIAARLGLALTNSGSSGAGYAAALLPDSALIPVQAARGTGAGADAVIVWGSVNDATGAKPPDEVYAAATATYRLLRAACPAAPLLVYGPQYGDPPPPPPSLYRIREAVTTATADAGGTFVDPLLWLAGRTELLNGGNHPGPAGHAVLADRIAPDLLFALPPARRPPRRCDASGWVAPITAGGAATVPAPPVAWPS